VKTIVPTLRGGLNIYINRRLVASVHNNVTVSFILSLIKAVIGVSSDYSGYFGIPTSAVVKLTYKNTPVTSAVMSHVSFEEKTVGGVEHTTVIYSFSDASRTKYEFDSLQLWTASNYSLLLHVSDAFLNTPLYKKPQDVVQIDWWVEMKTSQPFAGILSYLQGQQASQCPSACEIPSLVPNMYYGYSAFNAYFALLALPNILSVARGIKTPLTNNLVGVLALTSEIKPLGITAIACYDICQCQPGQSSSSGCICETTASQASGFVSEFVGDNYVYVAYNFQNPCPSGQYVVPITTLSLGSQGAIAFAVASVPSNGTGKSALLIKVPYGKLTLRNLFAHQGE